MGRPRKKSLQFSTEDRNELQRIASSRTEPAARVSRARALLAYEDGEGTNGEIASETGMSTVALANLVNKCISFGPMVALNDLPRSGRKNVITDEDKAYVKHIACYKPKDFGYPEELWSAEKLANHIREHCADDGYPSLSRINKSMVWKILEESGMKPHRIRYYLENRDPEFNEKMMQVLMVYKETQIAIETEIDTGIVTISYDEKPNIQALGCTAEDEPMTEKHGFIARDSDYIRHGTVTLLAGMDLVTGEIIPLVRDTHSSDDFIDFLKKVDGSYEEDRRIRIVLDNLKTHTSKKVMEYLATRPGRFEFVFTPKHGSWLNIIESFFGKLARTVLRGIRVESKQELADRIYRYIDDLNKEPVVYRWTYKMDEIEV